MKRFALTSILAMSLAACGSASEEAESEGVSGGDYTAEYSAGNDTTATVTTGGDIEVELPNGFETYPGSKVVHTMTLNNPAVKGKTVTMETTDSLQEVADFYRAKAKDAGIEINMETTSSDSIMLMGHVEKEASFNMTATREEEGKTAIQLNVSEAANDEGG